MRAVWSLALPLLALLGGCAHEGPRTVTRLWVDHTAFGKPELVCDRIDVRPAKAHRAATYRWLHLHAPRVPGTFPAASPAIALAEEPINPPVPPDAPPVEWSPIGANRPRTSWIFAPEPAATRLARSRP